MLVLSPPVQCLTAVSGGHARGVDRIRLRKAKKARVKTLYRKRSSASHQAGKGSGSSDIARAKLPGFQHANCIPGTVFNTRHAVLFAKEQHKQTQGDTATPAHLPVVDAVSSNHERAQNLSSVRLLHYNNMMETLCPQLSINCTIIV